MCVYIYIYVYMSSLRVWEPIHSTGLNTPIVVTVANKSDRRLKEPKGELCNGCVARESNRDSTFDSDCQRSKTAYLHDCMPG